MPLQSTMSPEWQKAEAAGLRQRAAALLRREDYDCADILLDQADLLERAYLEEGERLEDGRGPLSLEERAEMDATRVGLLP